MQKADNTIMVKVLWLLSNSSEKSVVPGNDERWAIKSFRLSMKKRKNPKRETVTI